MSKVDLIKSAKMRKAPHSKKSGMEKMADSAKKSTDNFLVDYVTKPLTAAGYPGTGAALGAVGSAAADFLIPSSPIDLLPVGKIVKGAKLIAKAMKGAKSQRDKAKILADALDDPKTAEAALEQFKKLKPEHLNKIASEIPVSKNALNQIKVVQDLNKSKLEKATTSQAKDFREGKEAVEAATKRIKAGDEAKKVRHSESGDITLEPSDKELRQKLLDQVNLTNTGKKN